MTTTLTGLPGVRKKKVEAVWANSPSGFVAKLGKHRAIMASGDNGSVSVYIDDSGAYRCHLCRWQQTLDSPIFKSKAAVKRWLKESLPRMQRGVE